MGANYAAKLVHARRALSNTITKSHQEPVSNHSSCQIGGINECEPP